jgi:hypothetical protein
MPSDHERLNLIKGDSEDLAAIAPHAGDGEGLGSLDEPFDANPSPLQEKNGVQGRCTPEAMEFCKRQGIVSLVEKAVRLAAKHFTPNSQAVYLSNDPEGEAQWLVVRSDVSGTVEMALTAYGNLKTEWLQGVSWEQSSLIRFLYNIV